MKPSVSVSIYRPPGAAPIVCADADEALGIPGPPERVPLGMAVALSVREHHDWRERARALARLYVAEATGHPRTRFVLDPANPTPAHLPQSVVLPPEFGGATVRVLCAHDGPCMCASHHPTRWLDVEGGRMVTVCTETKKVYWVERVDPLGEG